MNLMLLKDFFQKFPNEESCTDYFRKVRQEVGIVCPKCGGRDHKWLRRKKGISVLQVWIPHTFD